MGQSCRSTMTQALMWVNHFLMSTGAKACHACNTNQTATRWVLASVSVQNVRQTKPPFCAHCLHSPTACAKCLHTQVHANVRHCVQWHMPFGAAEVLPTGHQFKIHACKKQIGSMHKFTPSGASMLHTHTWLGHMRAQYRPGLRWQGHALKARMPQLSLGRCAPQRWRSRSRWTAGTAWPAQHFGPGVCECMYVSALAIKQILQASCKSLTCAAICAIACFECAYAWVCACEC